MASLAVRRTGFAIVRDAKRFVPVDTGRTRNSIGMNYTGGGDHMSAECGPTTNYAPYLEFGTSRMAPHAFMGPAADRNLPDFVEAIRQAGGDIL